MGDALFTQRYMLGDAETAREFYLGIPKTGEIKFTVTPGPNNLEIFGPPDYLHNISKLVIWSDSVIFSTSPRTDAVYYLSNSLRTK